MHGEKLHQLTHSHLSTEFFPDLLSSCFGNTADFRQAFRIALHDLQGLFPKMRNNPGGHSGPDALDNPAGQIGLNLGNRLGHQPFQKLRFKLLPVTGMGAPLSGNHQSFSNDGKRDRSHHRNRLRFSRIEPEYTVAIVIILINNRLNGSL